ncbi:hypothetical protein ABZ635_07210 [Nocardiopsis sp. NPDC007018]|uniref:hypothetical protein n=1 Tax=Nocardiopsis sp. NPDC007018 TaxID=3155721 RepID=UPI0033C239EA
MTTTIFAADLCVGDTIVSTAGTPGRLTKKETSRGRVRIWVDWVDIGPGQAPDMAPTDRVTIA